MRIIPLFAGLVLAGCATSQMDNATEVATAKLYRGDGSEAGVAKLVRKSDGISLEIAAAAPGQGRFGMHLHAVGKCDGPDFSSAGPHWNPAGKQHGHDNPAGAHAGDFPNLVSNAEERILFNGPVESAGWEGEGALFDADGVAVVIHEKADDYKTDPSGNSGKRIYCGVFTRD